MVMSDMITLGSLTFTKLGVIAVDTGDSQILHSKQHTITQTIHFVEMITAAGRESRPPRVNLIKSTA